MTRPWERHEGPAYQIETSSIILVTKVRKTKTFDLGHNTVLQDQLCSMYAYLLGTRGIADSASFSSREVKHYQVRPL